MNKRNLKAKVLLEHDLYPANITNSTYEDMEFIDMKTMWLRLLSILRSSPMLDNRPKYAVKYRLTDGTYFYIAANISIPHRDSKIYCNNMKVALESTPNRKRTVFSLMDWKASEEQRGIFAACLNTDSIIFPKEHVIGEIEDFIEDYLIYKN